MKVCFIFCSEIISNLQECCKNYTKDPVRFTQIHQLLIFGLICSLSLSLTFYIYVSLYTHKKISKTNWEEILDIVLHYSFSTSVWSVEKTTFSYKAPVYWKILGNEQWCCYLIHSPYSKFTNYLATSMPSFCWGILRA